MVLVAPSTSENKVRFDRIDSRNLLSHLDRLATFENRIAGTDQIREASLYINEKLSEIQGIVAFIDNFPIFTSFPLNSEVIVHSPHKKKVSSFPNLYSLNTPPEGIEGEIVYVGAGSKEDYQGKTVKNKIVMADLSYSPPRPEKAWIAQKMDAKAIILSNWGHPENEIVGRGAIKHRWGPLTINDLDKIPRISSVNIARKDAENLKSLIKQEKVTVSVKCSVEDKWVTSNQPMCRINPLKKEFNELLVVGAHLEAWGGTVTDNSTGNAIALEIARELAKRREEIKREVIIAFWDGHEIGEAAGSGWFVDNYWNELNERGIAYVNIDGCGMKGTTNFISYSSPETYRFLEEVEMDILGKKSEKKLPLKIGDNSFLGIGIPYIFSFTTYTQEELEKTGNAIFGWWYHSKEDTFDQLDKELLTLQAELYYEYIFRLITLPILPWDYELLAGKIIQDIKMIEKEYQDFPRRDRLFSLLQHVRNFKEKVKSVNETIREYSEKTYEEYSTNERENAHRYNKFLIYLGRYLNPGFKSGTEKYSHDPYGYSVLTKPLPRVYSVLEEISYFEPNSFEFNCLITQLQREFNYLEDAISLANYLTDNILQAL